MLDPFMRRRMDPALNRCPIVLAGRGISANGLTLAGFAIGMLVVPLLAGEHYWLALCAIALNRILDGLDGAVARRTKVTDFGGYLDIVCDLLFYAACVVGF